MFNRRQFIQASIALVSTGLATELRASQGEDWREMILKQPRYLWMTRHETGEEIRATYWTPSAGIQQDGYLSACRLLRDVRAGVAAMMDPRLLDVLCGIQTWLRIYGYSQPIVATSGYRTKGTNDRTEGAKKNSKHISAQAADIAIPGVGEMALAKMAWTFQKGGVGIYPGRKFVHVDTGAIRAWKGF